MAELRLCVCGAQFWFPGERWQHKGCMANSDVANAEPVADVANGSTYRYRDMEKRRAYQREYMRRRRADLR